MNAESGDSYHGTLNFGGKAEVGQSTESVFPLNRVVHWRCRHLNAPTKLAQAFLYLFGKFNPASGFSLPT